MRNVSLNQFVKLHRQLTEERDQIQSRLQEINEALGEMQGIGTGTPTQAATPAEPAKKGKAQRRGRKKAGGKSLREHVIEVLQEGPKTKEEVLAAVKSSGYTFVTSNPLNSLGVILYGKNPKFNRVDGKFSLKNGSPANSSAGSAAKKSKPGSKGQMSEAGRKRIAEAARKRWAAAKKAGKTTL